MVNFSSAGVDFLFRNCRVGAGRLSEESPAVVIAVENVRAAVTAAGEMMDGVGKI